MKKTKLSKNTIPLLMLLLLNTLTLAYLPITVTANPTEIEILTFFAEPHERLYWDQVIAKFETDTVENPTGITVKHTYVEFDALFDEIIRLHLLGQDPDIITMHGMWLPRFADYKDPIVTAEVPSEVVTEVTTLGNFLPQAVAGSTYKSVVYGYPTEIDSHALVYDKQLLGSYAPPTNWDELRTVARKVTTRDAAGAIWVSGFMPYIDGNEEKRYEFMNLLWSNNGEFLDLAGDPFKGTRPYGRPEALFNSPQGVEALQLFESLNDNKVASPDLASYDPDILPDIYWSGWAEHRIAMVVIPTWFNYIRDAIGEPYFSENIRVVPVPIGPSMTAAGGTYPDDSVSVTFNHLLAVTQRATIDGRAADAWTFVKWLNKPRNANYIPSSPVGPIPRGGPCSILGDYFIYDGIIPSRLGDQLNGLTRDGKHLRDDVWFSGFMDILENNGRPDPNFRKAQEVQDKVGVMFERVASLSQDPKTVADETAADVQALLPMPGDIDMNGVVSVADAVLIIFDYDATPADPPRWNRGRSDVIEDGIVDISDGSLVVWNFGQTGG